MMMINADKLINAGTDTGLYQKKCENVAKSILFHHTDLIHNEVPSTVPMPLSTLVIELRFFNIETKRFRHCLFISGAPLVHLIISTCLD